MPEPQLIAERSFDSAREFLEALRPINEPWSPAPSGAAPWLFRGQANAAWSLVPNVWRPDPDPLDVLREHYRPQIARALAETRPQRETEFEGVPHALREGSFAFLPSGSRWQLRNSGKAPVKFHWVRKAFQAVEGLEPPPAIFTHEDEHALSAMPDTDGKWATTRFIDPEDVRYDMHLNIVTFEPGATIPFMETHVMEHGLYVLEGKAVYRLNRDWVEVEAGDFMWLRAFCPQACYAGPERFRYLLYKDVNRHPRLRP